MNNNVNITVTRTVQTEQPKPKNLMKSLCVSNFIPSIFISAMFAVIIYVITDMNKDVYKFKNGSYVFDQQEYDAMMTYTKIALSIAFGIDLFISIFPIIVTTALIKEYKKNGKIFWFGYLCFIPFLNLLSNIIILILISLFSEKLEDERKTNVNLAKDYSHITSETIKQANQNFDSKIDNSNSNSTNNDLGKIIDDLKSKY